MNTFDKKLGIVFLCFVIFLVAVSTLLTKEDSLSHAGMLEKKGEAVTANSNGIRDVSLIEKELHHNGL